MNEYNIQIYDAWEDHEICCRQTHFLMYHRDIDSPNPCYNIHTIYHIYMSSSYIICICIYDSESMKCVIQMDKAYPSMNRIIHTLPWISDNRVPRPWRIGQRAVAKLLASSSVASDGSQSCYGGSLGDYCRGWLKSGEASPNSSPRIGFGLDGGQRW